jgi:hypothetical protein
MVPLGRLAETVRELSGWYGVLEIDGLRRFEYESV